jgi:hypothetical protein
MSRKNEQGKISGSLLAIIGLSILVAGAGTLAIWAFLNYNEQKTNVDSKVELAVAEAKKAQADEDEAKFAEREKEPNRQFVGPDDYGRLVFDYPKTWSVYVARESGPFEAYLNPVTVPPVSRDQQFALRVTIEQEEYDEVIQSYQSLVEDGKLRSSAVSSMGHNGTRLDGNFTDNIRGSAVIFRVRDKTITLRTDADTFKPDFEKIIKTIDFNQ